MSLPAEEIGRGTSGHQPDPASAGSPAAQLSSRTRLAQEKARVLREALPWVTRWAGSTVVVKYGGHVTGELDAGQPVDAAFAADIALLRRVGLRVVVVHGGGPQISALSRRLGLEPRFVDGRRVTDEATLEVVRMVLLGQVNPRLVGLINAAGAPAVGVSGTDAGLLGVRPADPALGAVGEVERVDTTVLDGLLDNGAVPVVATVGRGPGGEERNVNADTAAGAVAAALGADKLIYLTNVPGLYEHFGTGDQALLSEVEPARLREMLDTRELHAGMVPKVESMLAALEGGVDRAYLLDGRIEHALLLEIFTDEGIGTQVSKEAS
ncbi:MAG TPA: acetylglutamate kinase [Egibacteraceae bacterium]|jgi:acetylglutamate kinase|nr:acetylglutamate kinase [Egibacteraceae bacterium]